MFPYEQIFRSVPHSNEATIGMKETILILRKETFDREIIIVLKQINSMSV